MWGPRSSGRAVTLQFFSRCVEWPIPVEDLNEMVSKAKDISRKTFLKYVDSEEMRQMERDLGYVRDPRQGLTMANDFHVSYHRSTLRGCPAVYFIWSAIEHVFTDLYCLERSGP